MAINVSSRTWRYRLQPRMLITQLRSKPWQGWVWHPTRILLSVVSNQLVAFSSSTRPLVGNCILAQSPNAPLSTAFSVGVVTGVTKTHGWQPGALLLRMNDEQKDDGPKQ